MEFKFTSCPEDGCNAHSEVVEEEMWPSTNGGMIMAKVIGVCGHWFLMPAWKLNLGQLYVLDAATGEPVPFA